MSTRIYAVRNKDVFNVGVRLVEAATQAQALRHVAQNDYSIDIPNTKEVAELVSSGVRVESSGAAE